MVVGRIAVNVFKESVRDKVLYNLVLFAILLIAASLLLGQLTAGQEVKIIKDLGLAATSLFGLFIAVFIGIGLVSKEVERRSIYALLTKPISRPQFVVGKYLGLLLTLGVNLSIMAVALYAVLAGTDWFTSEGVRKTWEAPAVDPQLLKAILLIFGQLSLITSVALLFSTFSSPLLSAAMSFGLFIVGQFNQDLRNFEQAVDSRVLAHMIQGISYVLPNLAPFDVKSQVVHAQPVTWAYIGATLAYGVTYVTALLVLASWIFSRRDFK
jgi:ABC-type transport system involved in multi-copper enzyme maturation permease subunit